MSDDDLFGRLFELFNQPGPVNLKLAAEVARHLAGERQPVDPWAAEEFRELTRLAEFRLETVAPFPIVPAPDVLPVDERTWAEQSLEGLAYLARSLSGMADLGAGAGTEILGPLGPALAGMQLGSLVGALSRWVMAGFDAGVPVQGDRPTTFVVPNIDSFTARHGLDPRHVRLWVALNETVHRALFRVPWVFDHLVELLGRFGGAVRLDPERLGELMAGLQGGIGAEMIESEIFDELFDNEDVRREQAELEAFLGFTGGYTRLLTERAGGQLLPDLDRLYRHRDDDRGEGLGAEGTALAATFVEPGAFTKGGEFCREVARRYGEEALDSIWRRPGRLPSAAELEDPVSWAARVLLEDLDQT